MQQSSQVFDDPIAHVLDDVCYKNSTPLANHVPEKNVDNNLVQNSISLCCSTNFSYEEIDKGDFFFVWNQLQILVIHEI